MAISSTQPNITWQLFQQRLTKLTFNEEKNAYIADEEDKSIVINNRTTNVNYSFTTYGFKYVVSFYELKLMTIDQQRKLWEFLTADVLFGEHMLQQQLEQADNSQLLLPGYSHGLVCQQGRYEVLEKEDGCKVRTKTEHLTIEFIDPLQFHLSQVMTSLVLGRTAEQQDGTSKVTFEQLIQSVVGEFDDIEVTIEANGPLSEERDIVFFLGKYNEEGELNFYQYLIALLKEIGWHLYVEYEELLVDPEYIKSEDIAKYQEEQGKAINFVGCNKLTYSIVSKAKDSKQERSIDNYSLKSIKSLDWQIEESPLYPPKIENMNAFLEKKGTPDKVYWRGFTGETVNLIVEDDFNKASQEVKETYEIYKQSRRKLELEMTRLPTNFYLLTPGTVFEFKHVVTMDETNIFSLLPEQLQKLRIIACDIELKAEDNAGSQQENRKICELSKDEEDLEKLAAYQATKQFLNNQRIILRCEPVTNNYPLLPQPTYSIRDNFVIVEGIVVAEKDGQYQLKQEQSPAVVDKLTRMNFYLSLKDRYTVRLPCFDNIEVPVSWLPTHNNMHWPLTKGTRVQIYLYATYAVIKEVLSTNMDEKCTTEEQKTASEWGDKDRKYITTTKKNDDSMCANLALQEQKSEHKKEQVIKFESEKGLSLRVSSWEE